MESYAELSRNKPPSKFLTGAIEYCSSRNEALDLGAGSLRNTKYLLQQGFNVVAVDKDAIVVEEGEKLGSEKLKIANVTYDNFVFPSAFFDLVIAENSLPFESPTAYAALFEKVKASLKKGGVLAMTFFGPQDEWAQARSQMSFHSRAEIEVLCTDLEIIDLAEVEEPGTTIQGEPKHWHFFRLIAKK